LASEAGRGSGFFVDFKSIGSTTGLQFEAFTARVDNPAITGSTTGIYIKQASNIYISAGTITNNTTYSLRVSYSTVRLAGGDCRLNGTSLSDNDIYIDNNSLVFVSSGVTGGSNLGCNMLSDLGVLICQGDDYNFEEGVTAGRPTGGGSARYYYNTTTDQLEHYNATSAGWEPISPWKQSSGNVYFSGGNVGIGTSTPSQALHLYKAADNQLFVESGNFNGSIRVKTTVGDASLGTAGGYAFFSSLHNGAGFRIFTTTSGGSYATRLNLSSGGSLGIGDITPTAFLDIKAPSGGGANTDQIKLREGTPPSTPEDGGITHYSDNLLFTAGSTRYTLAKTLTATASLDFPNTSAQNSADLTITVTGAADGDAVHIGVPNGSVNANSSFTGWVSAADTVTIRFNNYSSGAIDPTSGTFRAVVTKY